MRRWSLQWEIRASQEGSGKLRLERGLGGWDLGKGDAGAPARARGSREGGVRFRTRTQSQGPRVGGTRGPGAARGARALCLRALQPARPRPNPAPDSGASASHSAGLGVSGPARGSQSGSLPCPCARLLCALREHGWSRGPRSARRSVGKARSRAPRPQLPPCISRSPIPRPPRLLCPRLAGVGFHGEVPGRLSERRQRHRSGGTVLHLSPPRPVPPLCPTTRPTSPS